MSVKPGYSQSQLNKRLSILKSGYKLYVTSIRIPLNAETKWLLEIVCLNEIPSSSDEENLSIEKKALNFLQGYLWDLQSQITKNKQDWIQNMKNN